jgi:hypothetical protein
MADHQEHEEVKSESLLEKISGKLHDHDSSSSSDSDNEKEKKTSSPTSIKNKVFRLFGREKPLHNVLGGGKRMRLSFFFICYSLIRSATCSVSNIEVNRFQFML